MNNTNNESTKLLVICPWCDHSVTIDLTSPTSCPSCHNSILIYVLVKKDNDKPLCFDELSVGGRDILSVGGRIDILSVGGRIDDLSVCRERESKTGKP